MRESLANRLLFWFSILSIIPLLLFSINAYQHHAQEIKMRSMHDLQTSTSLQKKFIENWFSYRHADISMWSESFHNIRFLEMLIKSHEDSGKSLKEFVQSYQYIKSIDNFEHDFLSLKHHYEHIYDLFFIDKNGNVLYSLIKEADLGTNLLNGIYSKTRFAEAYKVSVNERKIFFSDLEHYGPSNGQIAGFITSPVVGEDGSFLGVLAIQFKWNDFNELFDTHEYHSNYLIGSDNYLRTSISAEKKALEYKVDMKSILKKQGNELIVHKDVNIYGTKWILVNELDRQIIVKSQEEFRYMLYAYLFFLIGIVILISRFVSWNITKSLSKLAKASKNYIKGEREPIVNDAKEKEVYDLTHSFNNMLISLTENENMLNAYTVKLEERIEKEVKKNTLQQQTLFNQTRLAQMGEMISMIAHQWRQPLGAISATYIDLKMKLELEKYDLENEQGRENCKKYFNEGLDHIETLTHGLTTTIDDFKNFYKPNKIRNLVDIYVPINKALQIMDASLKASNIVIEKEYHSKNIIGMLDSEVMQVILNILKNAQDHFKTNKVQNSKIKIVTEDIELGIKMNIIDNAGGIQNEIVDKIFDPYFSTKSSKNGTGLGLYMSKVIILEHHNGNISVENRDNGACFCIELREVTNV